MSDLITIKSARVAITSDGVNVIVADRDAVHNAVRECKSNRLHATPDRQALAMFVVAMFRIMANYELATPSLQGRREWAGPAFIVDAGTMEGATPGLPAHEWNDQAFLVSALKWCAGVAGVHHLNIGLVRLPDMPSRHYFRVVPQELK
jgi:hypothetical protein